MKQHPAVDVTQRMIRDACDGDDPHNLMRVLTIEQMENFYRTSIRFQLRLIPTPDNAQ